MDKIFDHIVKTDVGLVRKANEDAAGYAPSEEVNNNGDLFVVCDGMGGHVGGAIASNTAVQNIIDFFKGGKHENPYIAIRDAIVFANEQIFARSQAEPELQGMGTTCTVLLLRDGETYIGHVGDSRIYIQSDDELFRVTKDHSFVQNLVDQGVIGDDEAESHPRKNELLKALGIRAVVEPEVCSKPIQAKTGDRFLMCSDGLCGLVNDLTMNEIMKSSDSLENKGDKLISLAKEAGGHDNITVAIIEMKNNPFASSAFVDFNPKERLDSTGEIDNLAQTQDLDSMPDLPPVPFYRQTKYQVIIGGVLLLLIFVIIAKPFGGSNPGISDSDSTQVMDSLADKSLLDTCKVSDYLYVIPVQADSAQMQTAGYAVREVERMAGDKFHKECLEYEGKVLGHKSGEEVADFRADEAVKVQPEDRFWLDCNCLSTFPPAIPEPVTNPTDTTTTSGN